MCFHGLTRDCGKSRHVSLAGSVILILNLAHITDKEERERKQEEYLKPKPNTFFCSNKGLTLEMSITVANVNYQLS